MMFKKMIGKEVDVLYITAYGANHISNDNKELKRVVFSGPDLLGGISFLIFNDSIAIKTEYVVRIELSK